MSLKSVPMHVRAHLYLFWAGMALAGAGVVGFFLSFWRVGSAAQASIDVHTEVPVIAYASILAWVIGLAIMWYSRRTLDIAVAKRTREVREATATVEPGDAIAGDASLDVAAPGDADGSTGALGDDGATHDTESTADAPFGRDA